MNVDGLSGHAVSAVAQSTNLNDVIIVGRKDELHRCNVSGHCINLSMSVPCVRNLYNGTTKKHFDCNQTNSGFNKSDVLYYYHHSSMSLYHRAVETLNLCGKKV